MFKVNYPINISERDQLKDKYYSCLKYANETEIDRYLSKISLHDGSFLSFKKLVQLEFSDLLILIPLIESCSKKSGIRHVGKGKKKHKTTVLNELFNYSLKQPLIAKFFMECEELCSKTCHYCGIEYINSFIDMDDYKDGIDFLNYASYNDLMKISGIGEKLANKILNKRKKKLFATLNEACHSKHIVDQLNKFNFKNGHNHFTLDHVLPQKDYKFYSLCLFNFVPSCYSCNSKFKKAQNFIINPELKRISPTSPLYSLSNDFKFKILYNGNLKNIKKESDFVIKKKIIGNASQVERYLDIFKIRGRYNFHKDKVLLLIQQKVNYPKSRIMELSKLTRLSSNKIKELVFGKEIFNANSNEPLVKLKRDVAENIGIIKK